VTDVFSVVAAMSAAMGMRAATPWEMQATRLPLQLRLREMRATRPPLQSSSRFFPVFTQYAARSWFSSLPLCPDKELSDARRL